MNTLWKHQTQHTGSVNQILGVYHNDVVHYLSLNAQQQPLSYEITKHPAQLQTNVTWVDLHGNLQLIPRPSQKRPFRDSSPASSESSTPTSPWPFSHR